jgi:hypothetical protein
MGKQLHITIEANSRPDIRALKSPNLDVFQELVALTKMQRLRVQALWEREITSNKPCPMLNAAVIVLRDMLLSVRKMKLELGIDEELAGLSMPSRTQGNKRSEVNTEKQVHEAIAKVEEIFRKRGIPVERPAAIPTESNTDSTDRHMSQGVAFM